MQPSFSCGYEPQQPRVLVRLGVNGDDLGSVDVEALEDLSDRFFAKPIGNRRVAPESAEVTQHLVGAPKAEFVRLVHCDRRGTLQQPPGAAERFDGDLACVELALQAFPGGQDLGRVRLGGQCGCRPHESKHLPQIGLVYAHTSEECRDLVLVAFCPVCGRGPAGGATGVPDASVAVASIAMEGALAMDAAHEPDEWV